MKKTITLFLAVIFCFNFVACAQKDETPKLYPLGDVVFEAPVDWKESHLEVGYTFQSDDAILIAGYEKLDEYWQGTETFMATFYNDVEKIEDIDEADYETVVTTLDEAADNAITAANGTIATREYMKFGNCPAVKLDCTIQGAASKAYLVLSDNYLYMFTITTLDGANEISAEQNATLEKLVNSIKSQEE